MGNVISLTPEQFGKFVIAQDDDCDWEESGYVALKVSDDECYLSSYGHCSCYGTFTALAGGGISDYYQSDQVAELTFIWKGSWSELVRMAAGKADPGLPSRASSPNDYDHDHLLSVYEQILAHQVKEGANGGN